MREWVVANWRLLHFCKGPIHMIAANAAVPGTARNAGDTKESSCLLLTTPSSSIINNAQFIKPTQATQPQRPDGEALEQFRQSFCSTCDKLDVANSSESVEEVVSSKGSVCKGKELVSPKLSAASRQAQGTLENWVLTI